MKQQRKKRQKTSDDTVSEETPSRDAVLSTIELVEAILCQYDEWTLLVSAQRVCTLWRDIILRSSYLQQRLFFKPEPDFTNKDIGQALSRRQNPLLESAFAPLFLEGVEISMRDHSLLRELPISNFKCRRKKHLAFVRPGASWRRMLVSQPPLRKVGYMHAMKTPGRPPRDFRGCSFEVTDGLRMGQFYDVVHRIIWEDGRPEIGNNLASVCWNPKSDQSSWPGFPENISLQWRSELDLVIREWWSTLTPQSGRPGLLVPLTRIAAFMSLIQSMEFREWKLNITSGFELTVAGIIVSGRSDTLPRTYEPL